MNSPNQLIAAWRTQAALYARDGVEVAARLLDRVANELEAVAGGETVSLAEAARRSGYGADHLRRMEHRGQLVNVGRKHAPRYRSCDLPIKGHRFHMPEKSDMLQAQSNDGMR